MNRKQRLRLVRNIFVYLAAIAVLLIMAFPLYGLLLTSLQPESIIRSRDMRFFPDRVFLDHYREVLRPGYIVPIRAGLLNSLIASVLTAVLCLSVAIPAAYSLSRLKVLARNAMLGAMISVYFLPTTLFLIPMFVIFVRWGIDDTFFSLVLAYTGFILPFVIWILKTFIDKLPVEVEEAARIDGASHLQVLWHVVMPLLRPGILAAFIFSFILSWVEFLTPLIFTNDIKISTVALGMFRSTIDIQVGQQAAAAILTLLPVALLMLLFQRSITTVMLGGAER